MPNRAILNPQEYTQNGKVQYSLAVDKEHKEQYNKDMTDILLVIVYVCACYALPVLLLVSMNREANNHGVEAPDTAAKRSR